MFNNVESINLIYGTTQYPNRCVDYHMKSNSENYYPYWKLSDEINDQSKMRVEVSCFDYACIRTGTDSWKITTHFKMCKLIIILMYFSSQQILAVKFEKLICITGKMCTVALQNRRSLIRVNGG